MSDTKGAATNEQKLGVQNIPVTIHSQYIKDVSFENPHAPQAFSSNKPMPELEVNIGMDAKKLEHPDAKNFYEVSLNTSVTAKRGEEVVFIAEVVYSATVTVGENVPSEQHHPILLIEVPRMLFPFVRQMLGTLTQQGGFPPVLITPVDFQSLYIERFKDRIQQQAPEKGAENGDGETEAKKASS